jgi:hypothetical protein
VRTRWRRRLSSHREENLKPNDPQAEINRQTRAESVPSACTAVGVTHTVNVASLLLRRKLTTTNGKKSDVICAVPNMKCLVDEMEGFPFRRRLRRLRIYLPHHQSLSNMSQSQSPNRLSRLNRP